MNGLSKAGIEINRKMLSEMAIDNSNAFAELVKISKDALNGKMPVKKAESKKEPKVEVQNQTKDYSKMTLSELKAIAKEKGIKGYSTMKKEELITSLN